MEDPLFGEVPELAATIAYGSDTANAHVTSALAILLIDTKLITKDQLIDELKSRVTNETQYEIQRAIERVIGKVVSLE